MHGTIVFKELAMNAHELDNELNGLDSYYWTELRGRLCVYLHVPVSVCMLCVCMCLCTCECVVCVCRCMHCVGE